MFTILMSVLMVLALALPAFAADLEEGKGTITINNATAGQSYTIYQIFETDSTGHGNVMATKAQKEFYSTQSGNPFEFSGNDKDGYAVSIAKKSGGVAYTNEEVIEFLQGFVTEKTTGEGEDATTEITVDPSFAAVAPSKTVTAGAGDKTVVFDKIPYGYYLVKSALGAVVTIDATSPNMSIYDKNDNGPVVDEDTSKTITEINGTDATANTTYTTAQVGDTISFKIQFTATNYVTQNKVTKQITSYLVTDTPSGLTIKPDTLKVKVGTEDITTGFTNGANGNVITATSLTLNIPWAEVTYNKEDPSKVDTITSKYVSPVTVEITYDAVVEAGIDTASNQAKIAYYYLDEKLDEDDTTNDTVDPVAFDLVKTDHEDTILTGAQFSLWDAETGGNQIYVYKNSDGTYTIANKNSDGSKYVDANGDVMTKSDVIEAGKVTIKGLDGANTYYLQEDVAPAGYNKLTSRQAVSFTADSQGKYSDNKATTGSDGKYANGGVQVVNEAGAQLPSTGGMGTVMFYVLGGVLVVAAGVLLVTKRRMKDDK